MHKLKFSYLWIIWQYYNAWKWNEVYLFNSIISFRYVIENGLTGETQYKYSGFLTGGISTCSASGKKHYNLTKEMTLAKLSTTFQVQNYILSSGPVILVRQIMG